MIQYIEFKDTLGFVTVKVPVAWFLLNENQQFVLVGADFNDGNPWNAEDGAPGIEQLPIGKVSEQSVIFQMQIRNSMMLVKWDCITHPNPEVIMLTDNRNLN